MFLLSYSFDNEDHLDKYKELLQKIPGKYPYYSLEFLKTFSGGITNAIFFVYSNPLTGVEILMPGYIRNINFSNT